jgi:exodeoxyribonuclease V alpha subunit
VVTIDGRNIEINQAVLEKLELGYAITIHKSQGSQWNTCILLLPSYVKKMLDKTLLYTAVTRPSKDLIIMGDKSLIDSAIKRGSSVHERKTNLLARLSEA